MLNKAYNNQLSSIINANRTSPFDACNHLTLPYAHQTSFLQYSNQNNLSNQIALNTMLANPQTGGNYLWENLIRNGKWNCKEESSSVFMSFFFILLTNKNCSSYFKWIFFFVHFSRAHKIIRYKWFYFQLAEKI